MTENLKIVEGQIVSIDYVSHHLTVKDVKGDIHDFYWATPMSEKMSKLRQRYFTKITAEKIEDIWKVTASDFFKKPDDWKGGSKTGGVYNVSPRNEKMICFLALHRDATALAVQCGITDFEHAADMVYEQAKFDAEQCMKDFGDV